MNYNDYNYEMIIMIHSINIIIIILGDEDDDSIHSISLNNINQSMGHGDTVGKRLQQWSKLSARRGV